MPRSGSLAYAVLTHESVSTDVQRAVRSACVAGLADALQLVAKSPEAIRSLPVALAAEVVKQQRHQETRSLLLALDKRKTVHATCAARGTRRQPTTTPTPPDYSDDSLSAVLDNLASYDSDDVIEWIRKASDTKRLDILLTMFSARRCLPASRLSPVIAALLTGRLPGLSRYLTSSRSDRICLACTALYGGWDGPITRPLLELISGHHQLQHPDTDDAELVGMLVGSHMRYTTEATEFLASSDDLLIEVVGTAQGLRPPSQVKQRIQTLDSRRLIELLSFLTQSELETSPQVMFQVFEALALRLSHADPGFCRTVEQWMNYDVCQWLARLKLPYKTLEVLLLHSYPAWIADWSEGNWETPAPKTRVRALAQTILASDRARARLQSDVLSGNGDVGWDSPLVQAAFPQLPGVLQVALQHTYSYICDDAVNYLARAFSRDISKWEAANGLATDWEGSLVEFVSAVNTVDQLAPSPAPSQH